MSVETVKMSSKGQIVIPQNIRDELNLGTGSIFAVMSGKDSVILKKIDTPSKEDLIKELERIAQTGKKRLQSLGIKEDSFAEIIDKRRKKK
jgi:AbrB family looped-hinge helix DNA binding protein